MKVIQVKSGALRMIPIMLHSADVTVESSDIWADTAFKPPTVEKLVEVRDTWPTETYRLIEIYDA